MLDYFINIILNLICNEPQSGKVKGILHYEKTNYKGECKSGILTGGFKTWPGNSSALLSLGAGHTPLSSNLGPVIDR